MAKVVYKIVKHENGWAYKARGTFSETFPTHEAALAAAKTAAGEQKGAGRDRRHRIRDGRRHLA
jgi:Uncharacterized protein conserved in bacteria (DUF2188)